MQLEKLKLLESKKRVEALFEKYGKQLFSYGYHQWKISTDDTWELVYATLYKINETIAEYHFESEQKFHAFIFRIFINKIKNHLRDERTKMQGNSEVELNEEKVSSSEPEQKKSEEVKELNRLLDELEDWQRILLLMRAQGFSYGEISNYVNRSEKNLKVYYGRLKKQIALKMDEKFQNLKSYEK